MKIVDVTPGRKVNVFVSFCFSATMLADDDVADDDVVTDDVATVLLLFMAV